MEKIEDIKNQVDWAYLKDEIPKALNQSLEGITKVSSIVLAMKEFSHPGGKEKQLTDLNRLLETTVTIARNEWKYVAEIDKNLDPHLPQILCLPNEIGQVFLNILVNAAHAIAEKSGLHPEGEKGRITLTSKVIPDHIEITFTDTGCGIPDQITKKVFDPFFTTKEVGRGTGQGLAISYDVIVKKHGGTIDFTSAEGKGTTFIIRLPTVSTESKPVT
jgi:signal transduction histidine kinase